MKYRKLRITWSVAWGIVAVSLIALWVRSNWYWDELYNPVTNKNLIVVESASNRVIVVLSATVADSQWIWHISEKLDGAYWKGPLDDIQESIRHKGIGGFAVYATPWNTTYRCPHWFLLLTCTMFAALPWLRWRFSLRTLLIAMTLVAVVIGLIVWLRDVRA